MIFFGKFNLNYLAYMINKKRYLQYKLLVKIETVALILVGLVLNQSISATPVETKYDICIYTANASGVMAAVAAAREGAKVVLIEPSRWLGGMTGSGLVNVDWGRKEAVGGSARSILLKNYTDPQYRSCYIDLLKELSIKVIYEHRLSQVIRENTKIKSIYLDYAPFDDLGCPPALPTLSHDLQIHAAIFIDCSYEGDLMANSGVNYSYGRESRDTYQESLAGAEEPMCLYNIDPYKKPGDPTSGLIELLQNGPVVKPGAADSLTMGYGFRWKYSYDNDKLPITPTKNYDPAQFELFRRAFKNHIDIFSGRRMRGKLGGWEPSNGYIYSLVVGNLARALFAPTNYGSNAEYPNGDYKTRAKIWKDQQNYIRNLTYFLRTDSSVPEKQKSIALRIGLQKGMFDDTSGYPHQLYIREARRMLSSYILTQHDLEGTTNPYDSVGLASYGFDEWPYATVVINNQVALMGGYCSELYLDSKNKGIYKIPYRCITPKIDQCTNLLVPVCISSSHVAMASIRMEPVWMILGESAGIAASIALYDHSDVQKINYTKLKQKLLAINQKLEIPTLSKTIK